MFRPMMVIIGGQPTLQWKYLTCITYISFLVRVQTPEFNTYSFKKSRIFRLISILLWVPVMFIHSRSSVLCLSCVCKSGCVLVYHVFMCLIDIHIPWNWPTLYTFGKWHFFFLSKFEMFFDWRTNKVLSSLLSKGARVRHCSPLLFKLTTHSSTERALISYACNSS